MTNKPTYEELEQRIRDLERAESGRKQTEETLREREQFLNRIINENPFPIWIGDSGGTLLNCNQALLDLLQLKKDQLVGKYNILEDPLVEHLREGIRNIFDKGETWTFEVGWIAQPSVGVDSPMVAIAGAVFPIFNSKGKIVNIVATYHDITERKQAEEELLKHRNHLEELVEQRTVELQKEIAERKQTEKELKSREAFLDRVIDQSPFATWISDSNGTLLRANPALKKFLNLTDEQLVGKYNILKDPLVEKQGLLPLIRTVFEEGKSINFTCDWDGNDIPTMDLKGSKLVSVEATMFPIFNQDGEFTNVVLNWIDISDRKRAEDALLKSEEKYRALIENLSEMILILDKDGINVWNSPAVRQYGMEPEDAIGKNALDYTHPDDKDRVAKAIKYVVNNPGKVITLEGLKAVADDGRVIYLDDTFVYLPEVAGINGIVVTCRNVTERELAEQKQSKMEEQLQQSQKMEAIGTLAGGIAHDFNNMLGVITGNISYLLSNLTKDDESYEVLSDVQESTKQAQNLTNQLLTFSKGGSPIKKVSNINELIKQSAIFSARGAKANCQFELSNDLWFSEVDEGQINQVIGNLIINANQAMPNGGTIKIRTENAEIKANHGIPLSTGRYIKVVVEDQGIGISKKHLPNIFEPYYTTKQKGSGLGLATAYSIIKKHDGHITVDSEIDRGTVFNIFLPASSENFTEILSKDEKEHTGRGKILVMDDQESILKMAGRMLNKMGYEMVSAMDGTQAIKVYRDAYEAGSPFDLVILDLTVPGGIGGAKTIPELLKIDPKVKAVVSSGYSNDPIMGSYENYGFCGVVPKPYTKEQLSEVLNKILGEKQ